MKLTFTMTEQPHAEDRRLARAVVRGDERAIGRFMDVYFPRLYRFALVRMNGDPADAEDVVQESLAIVARRMHTYRGEASLIAWLSQICRRELIRHQARQQRRVSWLVTDDPLFESLLETLDGGDAGPLDMVERSELIGTIHALLDQLPNRNGDVLEWKYIDGLSIQEIGERLEIGAEAVQSRLARARRAFRQAYIELQRLNSLEEPG